VLFVTLATYTFLDTGGTFSFRAGEGYYDQLADAFLSGQLYLKTEPPPELLNLPNPYDPALNQRYALHDASLYEGHYYLYFGPFPALIHAAWRLVTHRSINDGPVEVASALLALLCFWWIVERFRREHASSVQGWVTVLASVGFAISGSMLYLVARPVVYHEALLVALACTFGSWAALLASLRSNSPRGRWLVIAGALLGCAVGARVTYMAYAAAAGAALVVLGVLGVRSWGVALRDLGLFSMPLALSGGALLLYNWARFNSPFESGYSYQLASLPQSTTCGRNLISYFALYLTAIPRLEVHYPWVPFATGPGVSWPIIFPRQNLLPTAYGIPFEPPLISPFVQAPISLLALAAPLVARRIAKQSGTLLIVLATGLLGGAMMTIPLLSCANGVNFRYYADLTPALTLLGSLLFVASLASVSHRTGMISRRSLLTFGALSLFVTLVAGVVLGLASWRYTYAKAADAAARLTEESLITLHLAGPTTSVDTFPNGLINRGLTYSGIYDDGWLRQSASITLLQPTTSARIVIRGWLPDTDGSSIINELQVLVDGEPIGGQPLFPGNFEFVAPAPPGIGRRRIDLLFSHVQQLPAPETREASAWLRYIGFQPIQSPSAGGLDPTRAAAGEGPHAVSHT
jgi:hypothetical protein